MSTHTERIGARGSGPDRRAPLEAWLAQADQLLADQRAHSISPSVVDTLATDQSYQSTLAMSSVAEGLEEILERLLADPGRWILIIEAGPDTALYYVQYLLFEEGSLLAEAVSNNFLEGANRLTDQDEQRLRILGWQPPADQGSPNWTAVQATLVPDIAATAQLGLDTLRTVFRVGDDDLLQLKLFSSPRRGGTAASASQGTSGAGPDVSIRRASPGRPIGPVDDP
jgi:hypothetical protein